jgi:hypothetical protein
MVNMFLISRLLTKDLVFHVPGIQLSSLVFLGREDPSENPPPWTHTKTANPLFMDRFPSWKKIRMLVWDRYRTREYYFPKESEDHFVYIYVPPCKVREYDPA